MLSLDYFQRNNNNCQIEKRNQL